MKFKYTLVGLAVSVSLSAQAQDGLDRLEETVIDAQESSDADWQTQLSADDLVREMTDSIEDTVRYIPGVQVNDSGNRFNDNGFNIRGLEGDAIAVTIDGVDQGETLNPPNFAPYGMFGSSRGAVEVETVKSVRITRGPNSVTDGNGSLGGSVIYVTKGPRDFLTPSKDLHFGVETGYDERSDEMMVSGSFANRWNNLETALIYVMRDGSEVQAHSDGPDIIGAERGQADPFDREEMSVLAKIDYWLTENQRIGVVYENNDREAQGQPLSREPTSRDPLNGAYYDFSTDDQNDRSRGGLAWEWNNTGLALFDNVIATADYQELITRGITAFNFSSFATFADPSDDYLRTEDRAFRQRSTTVGVDFGKLVEAGSVTHDLVYGLEYQTGTVTNRLYDIRYNTTSNESGLRSFNVDNTWVPDTDTTQFTLYARDQVQLNEKWSLVAGVRVDSTEYEPEVASFFTDPTGATVEDADFTATVGELGVAFEPVQGHRFGVSVGQGYQAPTTQDLYLGVSTGFVTDLNTGQEFVNLNEVTNPNLEAEEATNFELSYAFTSERAQLNVTLFQSDYDNLIQNVSESVSYGQDITYQVFTFGGPILITTDEDTFNRAQNVGEVEASGIEVDGRVMLNEQWSARFGYSHVSAEHQEDSAEGLFEAGDTLASQAPDSAVLGVDYTSPDGKWGVSSFLTWTDAREETDDLSFTTLNNFDGPVRFTDSWTTLDLFSFYQFEQANARLSVGVRNVFDEQYLRWEVINNVRPGDGGFFSGAGDPSDPSSTGWQRFTDPGRTFSVDLSLAW
ncbi:MAG: TonB-dependent hemoglobin/transferrin/lactoferrin family receptor [Pseudomonadota bacterium]